MRSISTECNEEKEKKRKRERKEKKSRTNTSLLSCPIVSCLCGGTWRCGRRRRRRRNGQHQRTHPRGMLVHPATSELNTQPVQNPLIISPRRTASYNFSLLFFFPPLSLVFNSFHLFIIIIFFPLSRQFVHAQGFSLFRASN